MHNHLVKRKNKRANSHDEFCLGILDKDEDIDHLEPDMQPHMNKTPAPYEVVL